MKNTNKFALLLAVLAAGNSAQAQARQELPASKSYVFSGAPAEAVDTTSTLTYQWYRDGQPIAGATGEDYLLLPHLAYGTNVEIKRSAVSNDCPGGVVYTNAVNVSFGLLVGTVAWASRNVAAYQAFATRPDMNTQFYQWNRSTAWAASGTVSNWSSAQITDAAWVVNPCPAGWRLPTLTDIAALINTGSTWAAANTRGNAVAGRFFGGSNLTCSLPNNMLNCVFLPAVGFRDIGNSSLYVQGSDAYYWSSTQYSSSNYGYVLRFSSSTSMSNYSGKGNGFPVRCVIDVN